MTLIKMLPLAALLATSQLAAEEYPPFFPDGNSEPTAAAPQQQPTAQTPQATMHNTQDQRIVGRWEARDASGFAILQFMPNGYVALETSQEKKGAHYTADGKTLSIFTKPQAQNKASVTYAYKIENDTLMLTDSNTNQSLALKRFVVQQQAPQPGQSWPQQPASQPGQSWPQQPASQPGQSWPQQPVQTPPPPQPATVNINGAYHCTNASAPNGAIKWLYEFSGNAYRVSLNSMGKLYMLETGQFQLNGPHFQYYVTGSTVKPDAVGSSGTHYITPTANGFMIQSKEGIIVSCTR